eukprot:scaffold190769_cov53-Prasinocladus_malaysianus.AAC.1
MMPSLVHDRQVSDAIDAGHQMLLRIRMCGEVYSLPRHLTQRRSRLITAAKPVSLARLSILYNFQQPCSRHQDFPDESQVLSNRPKSEFAHASPEVHLAFRSNSIME